MKVLTNDELNLLKNKNLYFTFEYKKIKCICYYIWQGESIVAFFIGNKFLMYIDIDEYLETHKNVSNKGIKNYLKNQLIMLLEIPVVYDELLQFIKRVE